MTIIGMFTRKSTTQLNKNDFIPSEITFKQIMYEPRKYIINFLKFGIGYYYSPFLLQCFPQIFVYFGLFSIVTSYLIPNDNKTLHELEKINKKQDELIEKIDQIYDKICTNVKPEMIKPDYYESESEEEDECEHKWVKECRGYDDYWKVCSKCKKDIIN